MKTQRAGEPGGVLLAVSAVHTRPASLVLRLQFGAEAIGSSTVGLARFFGNHEKHRASPGRGGALCTAKTSF